MPARVARDIVVSCCVLTSLLNIHHLFFVYHHLLSHLLFLVHHLLRSHFTTHSSSHPCSASPPYSPLLSSLFASPPCSPPPPPHHLLVHHHHPLKHHYTRHHHARGVRAASSGTRSLSSRVVFRVLINTVTLPKTFPTIPGFRCIATPSYIISSHAFPPLPYHSFPLNTFIYYADLSPPTQ